MEYLATQAVFRDDILTRLSPNDILALCSTCHTMHDLLMNDEIWHFLSNIHYEMRFKYYKHTWKQHFIHLTKIHANELDLIIDKMMSDVHPMFRNKMEFWIVYAELEKPLSGWCAERLIAYKNRNDGEFFKKYEKITRYICMSCSAEWGNDKLTKCPHCGLKQIEERSGVYVCPYMNLCEYSFENKFPRRLKCDAPLSPLVEIIDDSNCPTINIAKIKKAKLLIIFIHMLDDTEWCEYSGGKKPNGKECLKLMYATYHGILNGFCAKRLESYLTEKSEWFIKQVASSCHCYNCDAMWFRNSFPMKRGDKCRKCGEKNRIFIDMITWEKIPPWIGIETYSIYPTGDPIYAEDPRHMRDRYYCEDF